MAWWKVCIGKIDCPRKPQDFEVERPSSLPFSWQSSRSMVGQTAADGIVNPGAFATFEIEDQVKREALIARARGRCRNIKASGLQVLV
jgi:hypothetical protein